MSSIGRPQQCCHIARCQALKVLFFHFLRTVASAVACVHRQDGCFPMAMTVMVQMNGKSIYDVFFRSCQCQEQHWGRKTAAIFSFLFSKPWKERKKIWCILITTLSFKMLFFYYYYLKCSLQNVYTHEYTAMYVYVVYSAHPTRAGRTVGSLRNFQKKI